MTQVRFNIKGIKELNAKLRRIDVRVERDIDNEIKRSTLNVESAAKQRAPVDTGRLRSSIRSLLEKLRGQVFTDVIYSKFIEFGTSRMAAQPFLFPSWEEERPRLIERIRKILAKII